MYYRLIVIHLFIYVYQLKSVVTERVSPIYTDECMVNIAFIR